MTAHPVKVTNSRLPRLFHLHIFSAFSASPRKPCLFESGAHDPIFPIRPVCQTIARARRAWTAFAAGKNLQTDLPEGHHRIHGQKAYAFAHKHLG